MIPPLKQDGIDGGTDAERDDRELQAAGAQRGQGEQHPGRDGGEHPEGERSLERPAGHGHQPAGDQGGHAGERQLRQRHLSGEPDEHHHRQDEHRPEGVDVDGADPVLGEDEPDEA
jgi:hypothetical protein